MFDYCYIAYSPSRGAYKIGSTANLRQRLTTLRYEYRDTYPVMVLAVSNRGAKKYWRMMSDWIESQLHKKFASKRIRGQTGFWQEWFTLNDQDLEEAFRFKFSKIDYPAEYRDLLVSPPIIGSFEGPAHPIMRVRYKRSRLPSSEDLDRIAEELRARDLTMHIQSSL